MNTTSTVRLAPQGIDLLAIRMGLALQRWGQTRDARRQSREPVPSERLSHACVAELRLAQEQREAWAGLQTRGRSF